MTAQIDFGYTRGLPDTAHTAWGARAIVYPDSIDIVPDRQNADGPRKERLLTALNDHVPRSVLNKFAPQVRNTDGEMIVFEDDEIIVKGNAQRSGGYLYMIAYFKDEA